MFLVKTKLAPSKIHGIGTFAEQFIPKGTLMWEFHEGIDCQITQERFDALPPIIQNEFLVHGWVNENGKHQMNMDNEKFINHSDNPNTSSPGYGKFVVALKDIEIGEEITQDYREFDTNFGNPEYGYDW